MEWLFIEISCLHLCVCVMCELFIKRCVKRNSSRAIRSIRLCWMKVGQCLKPLRLAETRR